MRTFLLTLVGAALLAPPPHLAAQAGRSAEPRLPPIEVFADIRVPSAREGGEDALVAVRLSRPAEELFTVLVRGRDLLARMGEDYPPVERMLAFLPGEIEKQIVVPALDDHRDEPLEEAFQIRIQSADVLDAIVVDPVVTISILDDDEVFTPEATSVAEGNGTRVILRREHTSDRPVAVDLMPRSGSAVSGEDFEAGPLRVTVPPDALEVEAEVATLEDERVEVTEAYDVVATSPDDGVSFTRDRAEALILDDDGRLAFRWTAVFHAINEYEGGKETKRYVQRVPMVPLEAEEIEGETVYSSPRTLIEDELWTEDDGVVESSAGEFRVSEMRGWDSFGLPGSQGLVVEYALGPGIPRCLRPGPGLMLPCEAWAFHMMEEWEIDEDWGMSHDPMNPGATITVRGFELVSEQDGEAVVVARKEKVLEDPGTADYEEVTFEILRVPEEDGGS